MPPLPFERLFCEIPCKQNHSEILSIKNPFNEKQCFTVNTELVSHVSSKGFFKTTGLEMIELLGNSLKDYKWTIYIINEGQYEFKVRNYM